MPGGRWTCRTPCSPAGTAAVLGHEGWTLTLAQGLQQVRPSTPQASCCSHMVQEDIMSTSALAALQDGNHCRQQRSLPGVQAAGISPAEPGMSQQLAGE